MREEEDGGAKRENDAPELMNKYEPTAAPYNLAHVLTTGGPVPAREMGISESGKATGKVFTDRSASG
jgi:hypothetical protein